MSRSFIGGVLVVFGLVVLAVSAFAVRVPGSLKFLTNFLLVVLPIVSGSAMLWVGWRRSAKRRDPEAARQAEIKDRIVWKAAAQGGRIKEAEAIAHGGAPRTEVEHALIALVSEGRAAIEAGEEGEVVYRVDLPGAGAEPEEPDDEHVHE